MSQDFIQAEAQKHSTITSEAKVALSQGWDSPQDSNALPCSHRLDVLST
jgi:hypothetical protein